MANIVKPDFRAVSTASEQLHRAALKLEAASAQAGKLTDAIREAAEKLQKEGLSETLSTIPVEALNSDKQGIRTQLLRDAGYDTVWKVHEAGYKTLARINGISEQGAFHIKTVADGIVKKAQTGSAIRIDADNRTTDAGNLVRALYEHLLTGNAISSVQGLYGTHFARIEQCVQAAKPATGGLRWTFCSAAKKQEAVKAAAYLLTLSSGSFCTDADKACRAVTARKRPGVNEAWTDFEKSPVRYYTLLEQLGFSQGTAVGEYGLPEDIAKSLDDVQVDLTGLRCTLRRYQEYGVRYVLKQGSALLGDEMGLGKTVQAIACMVALRNEGATHFLVVAPASVLVNWCREVPQHSDLACTEIHGSDMAEEQEGWFNNGGVAVTTYETAGRITLPDDFTISLLVVDEAHYVKNPQANRTKVVKALRDRSKKVLFMTGTALENRVDEMCNLVDMLQPETAKSLAGMKELSHASQFRDAAAPVYFRRTRDDVLSELPEKQESEEWLRLGSAEDTIYRASVAARQFAEMRRVSWNTEKLEDSVKAKRLIELCDEAKEQGRRIIVFSFFLKTLARAGEALGDRCMGPINGSVTPAMRQKIIDEFSESEPGTVLLSQIQAGGTGLNIQAASVVIFCEPQIKPSLETQAISRAYRMGQAHKVLVYRLLCEDSVDERIMELLAEKQQQFDSFAEESVSGRESLELSEKNTGSIMDEEAKRLALVPA